MAAATDNGDDDDDGEDDADEDQHDGDGFPGDRHDDVLRTTRTMIP